MDLEFLEEAWSTAKVESLLFGRMIPDSESDDGWVDVPLQSWYQLRCRAYDRGDVNAMHDVIQLEYAIDMIPDHRDRAAVSLAMLGWDFADIGAVLGGRGVTKTGRMMVESGVKSIVRAERRRSELRNES